MTRGRLARDALSVCDFEKALARRACLAAALGLVLIATPAVAAIKINFLYNASAAFVGLYVAKDQGILEKHGLDIDVALAQSGAVMPPALLSDSAQLAAPTCTVLIQAHEQGIDLVAIAGTSVYPAPTGQDGGRRAQRQRPQRRARSRRA